MDNTRINHNYSFNNQFFLKKKHSHLKTQLKHLTPLQGGLDLLNKKHWFLKEYFIKKNNFKLISVLKLIKRSIINNYINYIYDNNFKKVIFLYRCSNLVFYKKDQIFKILFLVNKLKNIQKYNFVFKKKKIKTTHLVNKSLYLHQNELKKLDNSIIDKEQNGYKDRLNSLTLEMGLTNNIKVLNKLNSMASLIQKQPHKKKYYYLNNMCGLKSSYNSNKYLRVLSKNENFFFKNINLIFFYNFSKKKKNLFKVKRADNLIVRLIKKKYKYYSIIFLNEKVIRIISPGILLKFFGINEKYKRKDKRALKLLLRILSNICVKFNKSIFNRIFIIDFLDKGVIQHFKSVTSLISKNHFFMINLKFRKEKRFFKRINIFKRKQKKKD